MSCENNTLFFLLKKHSLILQIDLVFFGFEYEVVGMLYYFFIYYFFYRQFSLPNPLSACQGGVAMRFFQTFFCLLYVASLRT